MEGTAQAPGGAIDREALIRALGLIFSNMFLYGASHGVTRKALSDAFTAISAALEKSGDLIFTSTEGGLMLNEVGIESKNPLVRMFITNVNNLEIQTFTIVKGITSEKFEKFVEIMNMKPDAMRAAGGFATVITANGLADAVKCKKITYMQVTEDEVVVAKEELEKKASEGAAAEAAVEGIVAFLKGDAEGEHEEMLKHMRAAASDASKLSELILRAAEMKKETAADKGESLGSVVAGCLRRAYEGLSGDEAVKTQKGKKELAKTLMLLEKDVVEKMKQTSGGLAGEEEAEIIETIEEMKDELEMDVLATDYMKKRSAIETNEKKILRYIKSKGKDKVLDSDLKARLMDGGLSPEAWDELLARSGVAGRGGEGGAGPGPGGGVAVLGHLAVLITHMEKKIEEGIALQAAIQKGQAAGAGTGGGGGALPSGKQEVHKMAEEVGGEVNKLLAGTSLKVEGLVKQIKDDEEAVKAVADGKAPAGGPRKEIMSRKKLLETLAEIVQEICQPLAVINCAVDMILSKSLGEVSETQVEMLKLANESGHKAKQIIDRLFEISGVPVTLSPDAEIQGSIYDPKK